MKKDQGTGHRKRLRDKYVRSSLDGFHDYEAVELLLTFAIPRRDVKPIAKELVRKFGTLKGLFDADIAELTAVTGVGENAAELICAIKKFAHYYINEKPAENKIVSSSIDAYKHALANGHRPGARVFFVLYLNSKNEVLAAGELEPGDTGATGLPAIKEVVSAAISCNSRSIIMLADVSLKKGAASAASRKFLKDLASACDMVEIIVHDLIFTTASGHTSARELGWFGYGS